MIKRIFIVIALVGLPVLVGYRFLQVAPYPLGVGQFRESPTKELTASATSLTHHFFFGGERRYYEFVVESKSGQRIGHFVFDEPSQDQFDWRSHGTIEWSMDSSKVTFGFRDVQVTLAVKK